MRKHRVFNLGLKQRSRRTSLDRVTEFDRSASELCGIVRGIKFFTIAPPVGLTTAASRNPPFPAAEREGLNVDFPLTALMSSFRHDALPVYEDGYGLGVGYGVFLTFGHEETRSVAGCVIIGPGSEAGLKWKRGFEECLGRSDLK